MKRSIMLLLFLLLMIGCSSRDISHTPPFAKFIDRPIKLKQPVAIVPWYNIWNGNGEGVQSIKKADVGLKHLKFSKKNWLGYLHETEQILEMLPTGHIVRIDRVIEEVFIDGAKVIAYGTTTLPRSNKKATFAYVWGFLWTLQVAPWEPNSTPERREIKENLFNIK